MNGPLKVMISSTAIDLPEHRRAAIDACLRAGFFPKAMEHLPAADAGAISTSLAMVRECQVYVVILAWRYGTMIKGHDLSVTEIEFDEAMKLELPILVFEIHDDHPITRGMVQTGKNFETKLKAFKQRASTGRIRSTFISASELGTRIYEALKSLPDQLTGNSSPTTPIQTGFRLIPSNVRPLATHIIERKKLVEDVREKLKTKLPMSLFGGNANLFADGGFGKSVLAAMYAAMHRDDYPGGMYQVACENSELEELLAGLLSPDSEDVFRMGNSERAGHVVKLLQEKASLLILDNILDRDQWNKYKETGYLNLSNLDILITTRADDIDLDGISVEALNIDETIEVLAKFAPSAMVAANRPAIEAIHRETGGLAVAVAAVGASMRFQRKDNNWAAYASWLAEASAEELPENSAYTGYKSSIIAVLRDLQAHLHPAQRRALEYAALLPPDEIGDGWLEWLLKKEAEDNQLELGDPAPGNDPAQWHLQQLQDHGLLRQNETGLWSVHRLHRKIATLPKKEQESLLPQLWDLGTSLWSMAADFYGRSHFQPAPKVPLSKCRHFRSMLLESWRSHFPGSKEQPGESLCKPRSCTPTHSELECGNRRLRHGHRCPGSVARLPRRSMATGVSE